ncbi:MULTISPECIES: hypothetical protein [unclassified Chelatococcus]|uniref:WapI family immunity protein n=1 Tax=unclassified Chelatococcus TaxID=2638111 RepID=UPI001BD024ED|nr:MULTISPECIES: hypothetical protein [unclassified Chelatococcus]MBS7697408.1 hypothetical protein [Chelatococcus sp. YT9]MBX3559979.1 hypothetical protein [Chelatococcus sp.]
MDGDTCDEEPDVRIGGLSLWVLSYERPALGYYFDDNWLNVLMRVETPHALVEKAGAFLRTDELAAFYDELEVVDRELAGSAALQTAEETLDVKIALSNLGDIKVSVECDFENPVQRHHFVFEIDQSYLPGILAGLRGILVDFPVIGSPPDEAGDTQRDPEQDKVK